MNLGVYMEDIMVSVLVITYQHKKYIRKALDSVLMQKVGFNIEIIVSDDCSTDGTQEILKEYKKKYGNRLKMLLRSKNVGGTINGYYAMIKAAGKYIVILDGDDFWTDEYMIQKQVEYLENHHKYMGVFHRCHFVDEYGNRIHVNYEAMYNSKDDYAILDFQKGILPGHTASFMYRNIFREERKKYSFYYRIHNLVGDQTLYCILLLKGNFGWIEDDMSAYRVVVKKNGTNAASIAAKNNNYFMLWKYYCDLEICMLRKFGKRIDLGVQRKKTAKSALQRFLRQQTVKNLYIYLKILVSSCLWNIISKMMNYREIKRLEC